MGTVVSLVLLVLSVMLTRIPSTHYKPSTAVSSTGILQFTWLLGTEPRLHEVERPDLHELRRAGLFDVEFRDMKLARRVRSGSGERDRDGLLEKTM